MSAIISYAHAAGAPATKDDKKVEDSSIDLQYSVVDLSLSEKAGSSDSKASNESTTTNSSSSKDKKSTESTEVEESNGSSSKDDVTLTPKKVKLSPAPLPSTNAWGATPTILSVDESPIAESIISSEVNNDSASLVKAASGKDKWVPLKASVVLASNKSTSSKNGAAKKKNKKKSPAVNGGKDQENKDIKKVGKKQQPSHSKTELKAEQKSDSKSEQKTETLPAQNSESTESASQQEVLANGKDEQSSNGSTQSPSTSEEVFNESSDSQQVQQDSLQQLNYQSQKPFNLQQQQGYQGKKFVPNGNTQHHLNHLQQQNHQGKPYVKHQNGNHQPRPFRPHNNNINGNTVNGGNQSQQGRRYSNLNSKISNSMPFVPYNSKQYYVPNQYQNGNPINHRHHNNHNNHLHNNNNRNSFQPQYLMQQSPQFYTSMPYMGFPPAATAFAPIPLTQAPQPTIPGTSQDQKQRSDMLSILANQIDYYFSTQNLVKDIFLRKHMNDDGFLPLRVIAGFYRVSGLSFGDINLVIESLPLCNNLEFGVVELEDGSSLYKIRAKDYATWILPVDQRLESGNDSKSPVISNSEVEAEPKEEQNDEEAKEVQEEKTN
ncbi:hypothetical protein CANARDRAFT_5776 [[Candida] arabinofermentans NRRL YB-2248]|uniref:HTH La-type RNA-binding domain-containing protein n=1 Tax=[Candida] arabinofermentans NRRL YB-2248 TaxID=983967 RepID=A0A1E4T644_9ASCO|nr:hypothetical protein CANARDRAFT_5776 [[Candida] arabinofermentans NRRL YB-2248]